MSVPQSSDDFSALRRALALKRHELPPPGYFESFSNQVMNRIRLEEAERSRHWWSRWFPTMTTERLFSTANLLTGAGAVFVAVSLTLILTSDPGLPETARLGNGVVVRVQPMSFPQAAGMAGGGALPANVRFVSMPVAVNVSLPLAPNQSVDVEPVAESVSDEPPAGMFDAPTARRLLRPVSVPVYQPMDR